MSCSEVRSCFRALGSLTGTKFPTLAAFPCPANPQAPPAAAADLPRPELRLSPGCDSATCGPQAVTALPVPAQRAPCAAGAAAGGQRTSPSCPQAGQQRRRPRADRRAAGFPLLFSPWEPFPPSPSFIASSNFRRENMQILLITDERRAVHTPPSPLLTPCSGSKPYRR